MFFQKSLIEIHEPSDEGLKTVKICRIIFDKDFLHGVFSD